MGMDDRQAVVLENVRAGLVCPEGLPLEDEVGDEADQVFDGVGTVVGEGHRGHIVSVHRGHQGFVKHAQKFSEPAQNLLG